MKTKTIAASAWTTASFGGSTDTSPMELLALGEHLGHCQVLRGRLFVLQCFAETTHSFLSGRFVTTLAVFSLLIGAGVWLL